MEYIIVVGLTLIALAILAFVGLISFLIYTLCNEDPEEYYPYVDDEDL